MLSDVILAYSRKYSHDIENKDYYLYWLENDILLELNDNNAMMNGIQPNLQRAYPKMSCTDIIKHLETNKSKDEIKRNIEYLWPFLPTQGKDYIQKKIVDM